MRVADLFDANTVGTYERLVTANASGRNGSVLRVRAGGKRSPGWHGRHRV